MAAPHIAGYSTAKHAQVGLMRTIAAELAPRGIRVNTIHPGPVDNEFQHLIEEAATGADRDKAATIFNRMIPLGQARRPDGDRARHAVPGQRRQLVHDRRDASR